MDEPEAVVGVLLEGLWYVDEELVLIEKVIREQGSGTCWSTYYLRRSAD